MKKSIITMMAALALCSVANSQEVMKLELKNGQVVTYPVENISRFYFEGEQPQQPQLAENCELGIADEVVLNTSAALKLTVGSEVERIFFGQTAHTDLSAYSDDLLCQAVLQTGKTTPKSNPYVFNEGFEEGKEYVFLIFGVNAQGKRGPLYKYHFTTTIAANEPQAVVTGVKPETDRYKITVEVDKAKVKDYYFFAIASDDQEYLPSALLGLMLKSGLNNLDLYESSETVYLTRNSSTEKVMTFAWARGWDGKLSGYINQTIWVPQSGARMLAPTVKSGEPTVRFYSEEEVENLVKKIRKVTVRQ